MALFVYFMTAIWKAYYHIWNQHSKIFLKCEVSGEVKKLWDQNCLIYVFLRCNFKKLLSYFNSLPSNFIKNVFLTKEFWHRFRFFGPGPGSAFCKSSGPGPLYKVYPPRLKMSSILKMKLVKPLEISSISSNSKFLKIIFSV